MDPTQIVDGSVMSASLIFALWFSRQVVRRRVVPVRFRTLLSLCLGPSVAFMHMWAHMFAVVIVSVGRAQQGTFQYDLRFYALLQMGVVLLLLSGLSLHVIRRWAEGSPQLRKPLVAMALLQMAFSFPLFPFNPIGLLPGLAALLLLGTLFLLKQPQKVEVEPEADLALV